MTLEEQKVKLQEIADDIKENVEKANQGVLKGEKISNELKTSIEKSVGEMKEATEKLGTEMATENQKLQKQYDDLDIKLQKVEKVNTPGDSLTTKLEGMLEEQFKEKGTLRGKYELEEFDAKAVADMTTGVHLTGNVIEYDRQAGIITPLERTNHVRPFFAPGNTISNTVSYAEETGGEGAIDSVAEAAAIPQLDFDLEEKTSVVRKVGGHAKISRELLEDIPALSSYVQGRLRAKYMQREDTQLLYGDGTGQTLTGIGVGGTAWSDPGTIGSANNADVLRAGINQGTVAEFTPNVIFMHPTDTMWMDLEKNSSGDYILPYIWTGQGHKVSNIPIIANTAVTLDNFIVGDLRNGAQIFDRRGLTLEVATENEDDFLKDLVTIKLTTRLALVKYRPSVFITGVLSTSKTAFEA